mmetsp:Transcript_48378/g.94532  ORF Transcript_48378/g.94532 Transcript_48378/m.94532 type:complete len:348 (+) Transcript_48378:80-1123(+)
MIFLRFHYLIICGILIHFSARPEAFVVVPSIPRLKGCRSLILYQDKSFVDGGAVGKSTTDFLSQIDVTVQRVIEKYGESQIINVLDLPPQEREVLGIAHHLKERLQTLRKNNNCPRCWLQEVNCFCKHCPPVESLGQSNLNRLFLLMHHKEIGMAVDTAKLILTSYPNTCRLVVAGVGSEFQESMAEMEAALMQRKCLVLFPDETARTFEDIENEMRIAKAEYTGVEDSEVGWDVIVIDGTWQQARRMQKRYFPVEGGPRRVKLSKEALVILDQDTVNGEANAGHQLRKHSMTWRKVGTFEATRLFLMDLLAQEYGDSRDAPWIRMESYQQIANSAAQKQSMSQFFS